MRLENYLSGQFLDAFKRKREKWIWSSLVAIFFPFVISLIVSFTGEEISFLNVFTRGDLIILFYSLTITVFLDLWNMPRDKNRDDKITIHRSFYSLLLVLFSQLSLYVATITNSITNSWILATFNIIIIVASYNACNYAFLQIFLYDIEEVE